MPSTTMILLGLVVVLAVAFDFINGFHDSANAIATSVVTRALSMRNAVIMAGVLNFIGAVMWTGVAKTIGTDIADPTLLKGILGQSLVLGALIGAIIWNLVTWWKGLPSSSSHALIGGLIGAAVAAKGVGILKMHGVGKIILILAVSPMVGFLAGILLMSLLMNIFRNHAPSKLNRGFRVLQILSAGLMAFSHGSNDAQKSMGIITMALVVGGSLHTFEVQPWIKIVCALAMALGSAAGGWRIIKTVGKKVVGWQPVHGFASETAASIVVLGSTAIGAPVSTTHVISSAIMGVGTAKGLSGVRWGIVRQIVGAWLMTLPVSALLGAVCYTVLHIALK